MSTRDEGPSLFGGFYAEMRRRHVVRFAVGYAAAAFVVLQLGEIVFPAFGLGERWLRILVIAAALGFPPALLVAWVFDVTPEGIRRTEELPPDRRVGPLLPRLGLMTATLFVVGGLAFWMAGAVDPGGGAREVSADEGPVALASYDPDEPIRSLAVLPLDNLSAEQDYFTAGMHEELIAQLSQISGLRVVSRTSVARYAGTESSITAIGRELGVDALIEGSVRRDQNRVRITIQLIHAASDTHIWSRQYDRELDDVLALQSEVALEIAQAIRAELDPAEETLLRRTAARDVSPGAADAYLKGRYEAEKGTPEALRTALGHFESAVREDSTFAPAMAGLAGTRLLLSMAAPEAAGADLERARAEALEAFRLDSTSMEAKEVFRFVHGGVAEAMAGRDRPPPPPDAAGSVQVIRIPGMDDSIVVDLTGVDSTWIGAMSGLGRRIETQVRRLSRADGGAMPPEGFLSARQLLATGQFEEAIDLLNEELDERPGNDVAWELLARTELAAGDVEDAVDVVLDWSEVGNPEGPTPSGARALERAVEEEGAAAYWRWYLERLDARQASGRPVSLVDYAAARAALGDGERALALLEQALRRGDPHLSSIRFDPAWDGLRYDPRFMEVDRQAKALRMRDFPPPSGRR